MKYLAFMSAVLFKLSLYATMTPDQFYSLSFSTLDGKKYLFSALKGKTLLIVNTASECGFTPQLKDLETINKKYGPKGLVIIAVPSNDFKQEKATTQEILNVAQKDYKTTFVFLEKQIVSGPNKSDLFNYLTDQRKNLIFKEVKWNFEKFLVDKNGKVVDRWNSMTNPLSESVTKIIEQNL